MASSSSGSVNLEAVSMSDLESLVNDALDPNTLPAIDAFLKRSAVENAWVCFEADVRSAAAAALERLRGHVGVHVGERCTELLRLCEFEEQTRCQAFQATIMGEVDPTVYQSTVRSILEKLLGKLETWATEPSLYQAAAQCLSEYMSALNHHCDICAMPRAHNRASLPAIAEGNSRDESGMDSSDYPSEFGSEDAETVSVHSETAADVRARALSDIGLAGGLPACGPAVLSAFGLAKSGPFGGSGSTTAAGVAGATSGTGAPGAALDSEEARKERRRESNKKASVKYRARKSASTSQVMGENALLRQQIGALTTQNSVLAAENQLLKQQVTFLQGVLQQQTPPQQTLPQQQQPLEQLHDQPEKQPKLQLQPQPQSQPQLQWQPVGTLFDAVSADTNVQAGGAPPAITGTNASTAASFAVTAQPAILGSTTAQVIGSGMSGMTLGALPAQIVNAPVLPAANEHVTSMPYTARSTCGAMVSLPQMKR